MAKAPVTCKRCGCPRLQWVQTKAGKWYLTDIEPTKVRGDGGRVIKTLRLGHRCDHYLEMMGQAVTA